MRVRISRSLLDAILARAGASPDREICGLLFGAPGLIAQAAPAANVHPDPARHFEVDPAALIAVHKAARAGGPHLIGHYHSHPSGSPTASAEDAEAAEEGQLCLIVAREAYRLYRGESGGLAPVQLEIVPDDDLHVPLRKQEHRVAPTRPFAKD